AAIPVQVYPAWQRLMWGVLPVGSLFVAATVFTLTSVVPAPVRQPKRRVRHYRATVAGVQPIPYIRRRYRIRTQKPAIRAQRARVAPSVSLRVRLGNRVRSVRTAGQHLVSLRRRLLKRPRMPRFPLKDARTAATGVVVSLQGRLLKRPHMRRPRPRALATNARQGFRVWLAKIRTWFEDDHHADAEPPSVDWQVWRRWLPKVEIRLHPVARRTLYGILLLALVLGIAAAMGTVVYQEAHTAEAAVLAYYDGLDFGRFVASYDHLQTNMGREEYLRFLSLRGGLVASFSKLENLYITLEHTAPGRATATVTAEWLTSLGTYPRDEQWEMFRQNGEWLLLFDQPPPPPPRGGVIITEAPPVGRHARRGGGGGGGGHGGTEGGWGGGGG
ncbi:MAG: hypothetical protein AAF125_26465, partial [Chloroflexota bacterium]